MASSVRPTPTPISTTKWIEVERIHPNGWNPNRQDAFIYSKELASIRTFGMVSPIIVRTTPEGYELIDGEHRWRAAKELGLMKIPIWDLGVLDDVTARQLTIVLNETKGRAQPDLLRPLLTDLLESVTAENLLAVLPFTPEQFNSLVADFDWAGVEIEPPKREDPWVLRTFRLPKAAADVLDAALARIAESDPDLDEWQRLEFLAAEYLGGR